MAKSSKGSEFERWFCRELSKWWSEGIRDDIFWRTAGSGAMAKTRSKTSKKTFGQYGDIQAVDPIGQELLNQYTFELKRGYGKWSVMDAIDRAEKSKPQDFEKFLAQVMTDISNSEAPSDPILVTKRDGRKPMAWIPQSLFGKFFSRNVPHLKAVIPIGGEAYHIVIGVTLEVLFKQLNPRKIK